MIATHTSDKNKRKIADIDTTNGSYSHKILTNREIPAIIQGFIPLVNQKPADGVTASRRALHVARAVLRKEIVMGAMRSIAGVHKDPLVIN